LPPENNNEALVSEQLVHRCLAGEKGAFDELVRQNMNVVFGLVVSMVHNFHTAEDIAQEVFTKAYVSLPRLQEPQKFRNWVCRIARNCCLDHLRQRQVQSSLESSFVQLAEPEAREVPGYRDLSEEMNTRLLNAIDQLRDDYREILILKHLNGLSYKDIGGILNMSVSAVGEKLFRVRQMLKRKLVGAGVDSQEKRIV
jgi:RNA polymerase sigma-70 factor (ECF subfamily)